MLELTVKNCYNKTYITKSISLCGRHCCEFNASLTGRRCCETCYS